MTVGERIAALREQRGWSRGELGRRMGTTPQQLERLEKGQRRLTEDWMSRAAAALEVAVVSLVDGTPHGAPVEPQSNAAPFKYEAESGHRVAENLPIYGTALGAGRIVDGESIEQTMLNTGDVVGYLKRPVLLNGRDDVYGLYVHGTSMDPVFCEGATIVAEMKRPARIGDDVVVYLRPLGDNDDGISARSVLVKRLVRRSATFVELQQFNPAVTFRIDLVEIVRIDRVMTLGDLLS